MKPPFQDYFRELIGPGEAEQFFDSILAKETRRTIRVNTLKISKKSLRTWLESQGYEVTDSLFSKDGLELHGKGAPHSLKLPYQAGFTYPQDASSMFAIEVLDPQPGETVLDLTAAPGGKSTHIAQRLENSGVLVANDMDTRRLKALHSNLERLGVWNTVVFRTTAHKLSQWYPETFDRILLDPSCSGEGLLVTQDGKETFWNKKAMKRYAAEQFGLLCSAFALLKPGGRLVYSTCTLNAVEDDGVAERLLEKFPQAKLEPIDLKGTPPQLAGLKGVRFWPHKTKTKGFFCIAITKTESLGLVSSDRDFETLDVLKSKQLQPYLDPIEKEFGVSLSKESWVLRDEHLFRVSDELARFPLPSHYSLSFPFLKLGHEPRLTHAGALWLGLSAKKGVHELSLDDVDKLFAHQPLPADPQKRGMALAVHGAFPLGWAKLAERGIEVSLPRQY